MDHLEDARQILHKVKKSGGKLKATKCKIFVRQACFLGRLVSEKGYTIDPADTAAIQSLKEDKPETIGHLRKLLGFLGYYRSFVPDFAKKAKPLYDLLKMTESHAQGNNTAKRKQGKPVPPKGNSHLSSKTPLKWLPKHQNILENLLDNLMKPPILAFADMEKPFVLHTDASADGLGCVLCQEQNGQLRVIGYGSRTLSPAEKNYYMHSGKLEFLALKWAVTEKFRDYLYYAPEVTVYTDNNPLTYTFTTAKLNATGHRWMAELSQFPI
jgi:hypothetical protein